MCRLAENISPVLLLQSNQIELRQYRCIIIDCKAYVYRLDNLRLDDYLIYITDRGCLEQIKLCFYESLLKVLPLDPILSKAQVGSNLNYVVK